MKHFVVSDTHFGHSNIIKYCNRPFSSYTEMGDHITKVWNSRVGKKDNIYFLGDFAMGVCVDEWFIVQRLNSLNGRIHLIEGNHDEARRGKMKRKGLFDIVRENNLPIMIMPQITDVKFNGKKYILCHYPLESWKGKSRGVIHLHGHSHSMPTTETLQNRMPNRFDVGVDMYGGPVEITSGTTFLENPKGWE